jgi:hypothetical protein
MTMPAAAGIPESHARCSDSPPASPTIRRSTKECPTAMTWQHPRPHRRIALRVALLSALAAVLIAAPSALAGNATGITIKLPAGFSIAGTVKTTGGAAVANATVIASGTTGSGVARTSATGAWSVAGLGAGAYKLSIYAPAGANLIDGWYTTANTNHLTTAAASASGIVVGPNRTGIAIKLPAGYTIAGKITTTAGAPLASVSVSASGPAYDNTMTDAAGNYQLKGLAAGSYTLFLTGPYGTAYLRGAYSTANGNHFVSAIASATKITVGPNRTGINAKVPTGFSISGLVTNTSGTPLSNVSVTALATGYSGSAVTDATGKYTITGLAADSYKLSLSPGGSSPYVEGFYTTANTNRFTTVAASASGVAVGPTKTGINVKITTGFSISGKLTTTGGTPLVSAIVTTGSGPSERSTSTDAAGNFKLVGLKAGGYTLRFTPQYGQNLQTGSYTTANSNRFTPAAASATAIVVGPSKTGVNVKVPAGYTISGKVMGPTGAALAYSGVSAIGANDSATSYTAADGTFTIIGLSAGTYKVAASAPYGQGLVGGWYTTANANHYTPTNASATGVTVGP